MRSLNTPDLRQMMDAGANLFLINVLDPQQFERVHIAGSINAPLDTPDFEERVERRVGGKDATVVLYCESDSCPRAAQAAEKLERAGFSDVHVYSTGMRGWQESGYTLHAL